MTGPGPAVPANWYCLGRSAELPPGGVLVRSVGPREIVLWRGRGGGPAIAFAAHCAHMGCHLMHAAVVGERLRCGLHHRSIAADGTFAGDGSLRQLVLPLAECLGGLWVRVGEPAAAGDLAGLGLDAYPTCYAGEHRFPLRWQALVANGFDAEHLASVHERRLLEPPVLETGCPGVAELRYLTRPTGCGLADRIIARLAPDGVRGQITAFNGSLMLVRGQLGRRRSFILMSFVPVEGVDSGTTIRAFVGVERATGVWGDLQARIAARLFKAFLFKDLRVLNRLQWHEPAAALSLGDRFMIRLCDHFRGLGDG